MITDTVVNTQHQESGAEDPALIDTLAHLYLHIHTVHRHIHADTVLLNMSGDIITDKFTYAQHDGLYNY